MSKKLNTRQKLFVEEYAKDWNATQAAIRAGYSKRTAYSQGQRLLKHVEIQKAIKELREAIQNENIATIKDVEEFLSMSMNGEIDEEVVVTVGSGDGHSEVVKTKKQLSARERIRAAELLGRRHGLFTDKVELSSESVVIVDDIGDVDED